MKPNKTIKYVDSHTHEVLFEDTFIDSGMAWVKDKAGNVHLNGLYEGYPTPEWLKENPRPR